MSPHQVVVVANPAAGGGRGARILPRVLDALGGAGVDYHLEVSRSPDEPEQLARRAAQEGAGVVAALGGDGTVGMVANGLIGTETALGVIPAGTGDDYAKGVGARRAEDAARGLAHPRIRRIDLGRATTGTAVRHFVCVAGAGFDSEVNETANAMSGRLGGTPTYLLAIVKTLRRFTPARFRITVDGRAQDVEAMLVAVGNGRSYGGGMRVTPDASITDGKLDVCVVGAMSTGAFLRAFPRVFRGTHVTHPKVTMLRGERIDVEADRLAQVYADGERVGPLPATFQAVPGALNAVVAEGSPADGSRP